MATISLDWEDLLSEVQHGRDRHAVDDLFGTPQLLDDEGPERPLPASWEEQQALLARR